MAKKRLRSPSSLNKKLRSSLYFLFLSAVLFSGCSKKINDLTIINHGGQLDSKVQADSLKVSFLGVACFLFQYKNRAVLTDPFISNPPVGKVLFGKIKSDTALVNKYISHDELKKVTMVVVGHSHYDHLLDLPYLAQTIPASATFCGNQTMQHTMAPWNLQQKIVAVNNIAGDSVKTGQWVYNNDSTVRIMAFLSTHPPHFGNVTLYKGPYEKDLEKKPRKTRDWKCGQTLSYLIDFMDNHAISYRIFFQSSGSTPPVGMFPKNLLNERKVDVAVYGIANDYKQKEYPYKDIDLMNPDIVFLAHWEDFMRAKEKPLKSVQTGNPVAFYHAIKDQYKDLKLILPAPGSSFTIE